VATRTDTPRTTDAPLLLTSDEVSERLGCSVQTVRRLAAAGRIPTVRFAARGPMRFQPRDVEAFVASLGDEAVDGP
jgi:excisionase family DNA binding protein